MAKSPPDMKPTPESITTSSRGLPELSQEPPVVARLIVEVRSDGSRTIARGAMEDAASGMKVAIEASGTTPLELALQLAKSIMGAPWLRRSFARGALRSLIAKL